MHTVYIFTAHTLLTQCTSHTPLHTHTYHTLHTIHPHFPTCTQTVAANMSGELHLRMEAEVVTATTYFKDLQNHQFGKLILQYKAIKLHPKMQIKRFT